jgi:hypothetical protein
MGDNVRTPICIRTIADHLDRCGWNDQLSCISQLLRSFHFATNDSLVNRYTEYTMRIALPLVSSLAYLTSILALPAVRTEWRNDYVSSLDQCPALSHKAPATSVDDL